ncbi:MAG: putative metalloprotease CJM1_0395 family protein [Desulfobacterales bacterium]|nr:putative metalloprotease CJM1_0395 family protein [Desulfobacterales bacterium]
MNINSTNNYSPGKGYSGGNPARASITSGQSKGDFSQEASAATSVSPLPGQPSSQTTSQTNSATDPDLQGTGTSNPQPEQQPLEKKVSDNPLTQAELQLIMELEQIDTEVRNHEMAHIAAGGSLITSGASFTYKRGPDGNNYAVAGEVGIDTSEIPGDPKATAQKMRQVKSAALAPANPSAQDLKVASKAAALAAKASSELTMLQAKQQAETNEAKAFGNIKQASDSYIKVNNLPENETRTFNLAV